MGLVGELILSLVLVFLLFINSQYKKGYYENSYLLIKTIFIYLISTRYANFMVQKCRNIFKIGSVERKSSCVYKFKYLLSIKMIIQPINVTCKRSKITFTSNYSAYVSQEVQKRNMLFCESNLKKKFWKLEKNLFNIITKFDLFTK